MKYMYRIGPGGVIVGLYSDVLAGIGGVGHVRRASDVEFVEERQAWRVTFRVGPYGNASLLKLFRTRREALAEEVAVLNHWLEKCKEHEWFAEDR